MFVISLFSILIYSPTKSPQSLIIFFQIELFKSSGEFFIFFSYRNIYRRKQTLQCEFFQYRAALIQREEFTMNELRPVIMPLINIYLNMYYTFKLL